MNFSNNSPLKTFFYIKKIPRCGCHSMLAFLLFRAENYSNQGNCHSENFQCNIYQNIPTSHKIYHSFYDTLNDSINTDFFFNFPICIYHKIIMFLQHIFLAEVWFVKYEEFNLLNMHSFYSWLLYNDIRGKQKSREICKVGKAKYLNIWYLKY